jgi:hypothetical protein
MSPLSLSPVLPAVTSDETVVQVPTSVFTGTACMALMDVECAAEVWRDILFDGHDHEHGDGGLMLNSAALGTHVEHDGDFPAVLYTDVEGAVYALVVNVDPYGADLESLRLPAGHAHPVDEHVHAHAHGGEDEHTHAHHHDGDHDHDHGHDHGHGPVADGWSRPVEVFLLSDRAVFGDPAGLPEADNTGGLLEVRWPERGGVVHASVFTERGVRRSLVAVWVPDVA